MLAGSRRPYHAVNEQHHRRCGVTTAGRPRPRWAAVAQGAVTFRMHITGWSRPLVLFGAKETSRIIFHTTSICLLAHDGRTMPSVPCRQREAQLPLWSHNRGATAATVGRGHSRGSHPSYAYQRAESPSRPVWRKDTSRIVFIVRLAHNASICYLARNDRTRPSASSTVAAVTPQRRLCCSLTAWYGRREPASIWTRYGPNVRCGVTTAG